MNNEAHSIECGMMSQYHTTPYGIKNLSKIITKRLLIQGFIIFDHYGSEHYGSFQKDMSQWLKEGKLKYKEHIVNGIENAPKAFLDLFKGKNFGKLLVKINDL